jgi:hypothetical protein
MQLVFLHCHALAKGVQSAWGFPFLPFSFSVLLNPSQMPPLKPLMLLLLLDGVITMSGLLLHVFQNISCDTFTLFTSLGTLTGLCTLQGWLVAVTQHPVCIRCLVNTEMNLCV